MAERRRAECSRLLVSSILMAITGRLKLIFLVPSGQVIWINEGVLQEEREWGEYPK